MSQLTDRYGAKTDNAAQARSEYRVATQRKLQHFATQQERIEAFRQRAEAQSGNRRQAVSGRTEQYRGASPVVRQYAAGNGASDKPQHAPAASPVVRQYGGRAPQQQHQQSREQGRGLAQ